MKTQNTIKLSPAQIEMLQMSEDDIANGRTISHEDLKSSDPDWLK